MNENDLMSQMKISKAVATMAIPSVISSLVTVVYNMADTFFVGQTGDSLQVAAVSLTNPIFILFMAFANMFGMGGSAAASIAMGEKNEIGIVFKANMFITFLQMGLANGVQPLLGYNFGSGNVKRFREVESYTKKCCVIVGIIVTALYFVFRTQIITMFISDPKVIQYGVAMLIAYMISGPVIGILFVNMNCMQSIGRALSATIVSVLRQGVLLIPLLYFLNAIAGLNGVIYGQALTDIISIILSVILWIKCRKELETQK